jgi:hypothetical protein
MNILDITIKKLTDDFGIPTFFKGCNIVSKEDATELQITYDKEGEYVGIKYKSNKKTEITYDDITTIKEVKKTNPGIFKELSIKCGCESSHTLYGLSLCCINPHFRENEEKLDKKLKNLGIESKKEYSDNRLVLRYKISKTYS